MTNFSIFRRVETFAKATLIGVAAVAASASFSQTKWPMEKPMTLVVPFAAGSAFDNVARVLADGLRKKYGNTVLVDNRSGASGGIGQSLVAKAAPDGYTFIVTTPGPAANNMLTFKSLPYNPMTDFSFVGLVLRDPILLAVRKDMPVSNFKEFIAYTKANPGKVSMGNPGNGSTAHMTQMALQDIANVQFNIIPYRVPTQVMTDLMGGQIDAGMALAGNLMSAVKSGRLKPLAVFGSKRGGAQGRSARNHRRNEQGDQRDPPSAGERAEARRRRGHGGNIDARGIRANRQGRNHQVAAHRHQVQHLIGVR